MELASEILEKRKMELADKMLERMHTKAEEAEFAYDDFYQAEIKNKKHLEFEEIRKWLLLYSIDSITSFEYHCRKIALDYADLNSFDIHDFVFWSEIKEAVENSKSLEELIDGCKKTMQALDTYPSWLKEFLDTLGIKE